MLTLILGRAGTGKTLLAMEDFAERVGQKENNLYYIVPEQYSHDAERQLLKICSDTLSLRGEVLSFSRLCSRVFAETGGPAHKTLDKGGKILYMNRAVDAVSNQLKLYGQAERKAEFLEHLIQVAGEFKSACVAPDDLMAASQSAESPLREKLCDLAVILSAYDAFFGEDAADPDDRLNFLAQVIKKSTMFISGHVYFDGFSDFTGQEQKIVETLLAMETDMTVCLTCDGIDGTDELFAPSRTTALRLMRTVEDNGIKCRIINKNMQQTVRAADLLYAEQNLFGGDNKPYSGTSSSVELLCAPSPSVECEYAASRVLRLVRAGCRWRDIAVAICDFTAYGRMAEDIFTRYGIPVFSVHKTEITQKPPLALIDAVLEIITGGWDCRSVFRYLKTGMTGLSPDDIDVLENYALLWNLKGAVWTRDEDWTQAITGFEPGDEKENEARLAILNDIRRRAVGPVVNLRKALAGTRTYGGKVRALYGFLEEIGLPERLAEKETSLRAFGDMQLADEYRQLWDIIVHAIEQFHEVLGDNTGSNQEFMRLWKLLTAQYDIASIPVALDRVGVGEMSRQRRRDLKHLIVIGAGDDVLPKTGGGGLLSDGERSAIQAFGIRLPGGWEERLYREMNAIYSTLTLPSSKLIVSYHKSDGHGEKRPSFVIKRLSALFDIPVKPIDTTNFRLDAYRPCLELAASRKSQDGLSAAAAEAYLNADPASQKRLAQITGASAIKRGKLSRGAAAMLYGSELSISASRVEKFYACRYQYFLQYGLSAKPRRPAGFDAPTAGTFMHYVLENVTREIKETDGFSNVDDETCKRLTEKYADEYARDVLQSFKDKTDRFIYLFNRLKKDAVLVMLDMVGELRHSDFIPLDFELAFTDGGDIRPRLIESGGTRLKIKGFIDRLDGWESGGKLYIRVVDYKTGRKKFSLSDVSYGMNMQMLIYLFTLEKNGGVRYGKEIVPAGVLYAPARDEYLAVSRNISDEELSKQRAKKLRRSGLLLDDPAVIEAMEHGAEKKYLPVKTTGDGTASGDMLADTGQLEQLSVHIDKQLIKIAESVHGGSIEAKPYFKSRDDTACVYCDYKSVCHFSEKDGDTRRYLKKLTSDEMWRQIAGGESE